MKKERNFGFSVGMLSVPNVKYRQFKKERTKTTNAINCKADIQVIDTKDASITCTCSLRTKIDDALVAADIMVEAVIRVIPEDDSNIEEKDVRTLALAEMLLFPLTEKTIEVYARLTGDSGAFPIILNIKAKNLAKSIVEDYQELEEDV